MVKKVAKVSSELDEEVRLKAVDEALHRDCHREDHGCGEADDSGEAEGLEEADDQQLI